jgi:cytochrome c peroxidase
LKSASGVYKHAVRLFVPFAATLVAVLGAAGCNASLDTRPDANISPQRLFMFAPIPPSKPLSGLEAERVDLGRRLFYDTHISENSTVSCNSCHLLAEYGVDHRPHSLGHDNRPGGRNAPTVYNSGLEFAQFWDGRAPNLAAQASGPMMNPVEMGMAGPEQILAYVRSNPAYVKGLHSAFPDAADPVSLDTITTSIADFEDGLLTPSRWDRYLRGDTSALTDGEKQGLRVFLRSGCEACHAGRDMGGNSYEQLGAATDWHDQQTDPGRFQTSNQPRDRMFFKVPTLRNIEKTGPYFHDGHVATLDEAVRLMGRHEAGLNLSDQDVQSIVTFLHALTGEIPWSYIQPPNTASPAAPSRPSPIADNEQQHAGAAFNSAKGAE